MSQFTYVFGHIKDGLHKFHFRFVLQIVFRHANQFWQIWMKARFQVSKLRSLLYDEADAFENYQLSVYIFILVQAETMVQQFCKHRKTRIACSNEICLSWV